MPTIMDKKTLDSFVSRMAAGKSKAAEKRVSSNAPPSPPPKTKSTTGAALNAVKPPKTKLPKPASGGSGPTMQTGSGGGHTITIKIGR